MQLTDMHNSVVLFAILGLVILPILKTQNDEIVTQIIGTMSLFDLEEYISWWKERSVLVVKNLNPPVWGIPLWCPCGVDAADWYA